MWTERQSRASNAALDRRNSRLTPRAAKSDTRGPV